MKALTSRRPSGAMVVAIIALVFAVSGTAIAASHLVNGDKLIKKHSLSGNRLRNHTLTGTQINLNKLGKVPSAKNADVATLATNATNATSATKATNATNATNAGNANTLGGQPASAFEPASSSQASGIVNASVGQTVTLATFGPFTVSLTCTSPTAGQTKASLDATSSEDNSDIWGTIVSPAGTSTNLFTSGPSATFSENDDNVVNFFAPSGAAYESLMVAGVNSPNGPNACYADALTSKS